MSGQHLNALRSGCTSRTKIPRSDAVDVISRAVASSVPPFQILRLGSNDYRASCAAELVLTQPFAIVAMLRLFKAVSFTVTCYLRLAENPR